MLLSRKTRYQIQRLVNNQNTKSLDFWIQKYQKYESRVKKYFFRLSKLRSNAIEIDSTEFLDFLSTSEMCFKKPYCIAFPPSNIRSSKDPFCEFVEEMYQTTKGFVRCFTIFGDSLFSKESFFKIVLNSLHFSMKKNTPELFELYERKLEDECSGSNKLAYFKKRGGGICQLKLDYLVSTFPVLVPRTVFVVNDIHSFFSETFPKKGDEEKIFKTNGEKDEFLHTLSSYHTLCGQKICFYFRQIHQYRSIDIHKFQSVAGDIHVFQNMYPSVDEISNQDESVKDHKKIFWKNYVKYNYDVHQPFLRDHFSTDFKKCYRENNGNYGKYAKSQKDSETLSKRFSNLELSDLTILNKSEKLLLLGFYLSSRVKDMKKWESTDDDGRSRTGINPYRRKKDKITNLVRVSFFTDNLFVSMKKVPQPKTEFDRNLNERIEALVSGGWVNPISSEKKSSESVEYVQGWDEDFEVNLSPQLAARIAHELGIRIESYY